jgi:hypothetical protein
MNFVAKSYAKTHSKRPSSTDSGIKSHPDPRKYPRKPCLKSVFFNCGDQRYAGLIKNISRGGVFIETADKFLFGQSIELLEHPNRSGQTHTGLDCAFEWRRDRGHI